MRPTGMECGKCIVLLAAAGVIAGCASSGSVTGPVAAGAWGGVGVSLLVEEADAFLEFDCALGAILTPLRIDADGAFSIGGTYTREHGGPVREDEELETATATYAGVVDGDRMTLTVVVEGEAGVVGPFALERGATPILRKCL